MKPDLPYSVLLAMTIAVSGFTILYNLVLQPHYATMLRYAGAETSSIVEEAASPDFLRVYADESNGENAQPTEDGALTSVQFPLNINTATAEQLEFIPKVGEVLAQRIIQYRDALGGYQNLEQLMEIKGIGDSTYEQLYPYLYVAQQDGQYLDAAPEE